MANVVSPNEAAIDILIRDLINTSCEYKYDKEDAKWTHNALKDLITSDKISPEIIYRGLALLNRNSICGRFALTFNELFYTGVINRNIQDIFVKSPFPEGEDNSELTDVQKKFLEKRLQIEMLTINLALDYVSKMEEPPKTILREDLYRNCFKEVCISKIINTEHSSPHRESKISDTEHSSPHHESKILDTEIISEEKIIPFLSLVPRTTFVSTSIKTTISSPKNNSDEKTISEPGQIPTKYTWCFDLLELVTILATTKINPYTRGYFDDDLVKRLNGIYDLEIKMYHRFLKR